MRLLHVTTILPLLTSTILAKTTAKEAADKADKSNWTPCTAESATSGNYFDINPLAIHAPDPDDKQAKKKDKDRPVQSWHARGHDYGANFTLNFCAPVVEELDDVEDLEKRLWRNVSAFYERKGTKYSIGQTNMEPVVRGRKLVLNYTHGSLCPDVEDLRKRGKIPANITHTDPSDEELGMMKDKHEDDDDDDEDENKGSKKHKGSSSKNVERRKSSVVSLLCERNPKDGDPLVTVSFVGTTDECTYFFEARSKHACATAKVQSQPLGPSSVFGIITLIVILVYLIGGIMYQRIVQHQRGWRQLPNYTLWSNIFSFVVDMTIICVSSLGRCIPGFDRFFGARKGGYNRLSLNEENGFANGSASGRGRRGNEEENRLIDQLDEQWED